MAYKLYFNKTFFLIQKKVTYYDRSEHFKRHYSKRITLFFFLYLHSVSIVLDNKKNQSFHKLCITLFASYLSDHFPSTFNNKFLVNKFVKGVQTPSLTHFSYNWIIMG